MKKNYEFTPSFLKYIIIQAGNCVSTRVLPSYLHDLLLLEVQTEKLYGMGWQMILRM